MINIDGNKYFSWVLRRIVLSIQLRLESTVNKEGYTKSELNIRNKSSFKNIRLHNGRPQNVWDSKCQNGEMAKAKLSGRFKTQLDSLCLCPAIVRVEERSLKGMATVSGSLPFLFHCAWEASTLEKSHLDSLYAGYSEPLFPLRAILYMGAPVHVQCALDAHGLK